MTDIIPVNDGAWMPILSGFFGDFAANDYVEDKFEDMQAFGKDARDRAMASLNHLEQTETVPGLENITRNFDFPEEPPDISDLSVPEPPEAIQVPKFDGTFPTIDHLTPPRAIEPEGEVSYPADIRERIKSEIFDGLNNPDGGYTPDVEQGIYDRARSRRRADLQDKKDQVFAEQAKRDFPTPPGAVLAAIRRYDVEDHREETDLNRDIVQNQADLARQKYEFLMQAAQTLESHLLDLAYRQAQTALEKSRLQMQFALDVFGTYLRKAEIQSTLLQTEVQLYAEQVRMQMTKFEAYRAQVQGIQSKAELERLKVQIFSEQRQARTSKYSMQLEQDRLNLEYAQAKAAHKREIASQMSSVATQLAASAMTAVSAQVGLSGSQSDNRGMDYQASVSRTDYVELMKEETTST